MRNEMLLLKILNLSNNERELVNKCLLEGIYRGFISISTYDDLNNILLSGECYNCKFAIEATIKDCLYQSHKGDDFQLGGVRAAKMCPSCGLGNYVNGICSGNVSMSKFPFYVFFSFCLFLT